MNRTLSAILLAALLTPSIHAATLGNFTYTDKGSTITIDDFTHYIKGDIVVPATINGKPVTEIGPSAFSACRRITSITLPESVTKIGMAAFSICDKMQSVNIPSGVTAIEDRTFEWCEDLQQLDLPTGITHIGAGAFRSCSTLQQLHLPASVTHIGAGAFQSCSSLKSFELPPLVTTFSQGMLESCMGLTNITIPSRVTRIEDGALAGTGIKSLRIPKSVEFLGERQFYGCKNLRTVEIQTEIKEIGEMTFAFCDSLEKVELPKSVRKIGVAAFRDCGLTEIPDANIREIGRKAFWNCNRLTSASIPKTVVRIDDQAFLGCDRMAGVRFDGDAPQMGAGVFDRTASDFRIFIEDNRTGFTIPRWLGYRLSRPRAEVLIQNSTGKSLENGNVRPVQFDSVIVGKKSRAQSLVITNVGNRPLTGIGSSFKGEGFLEYAITKAPVTTLAPGESTVIKFAFKPMARGKRTVSLQVFSSDADEAMFVIPLTGIGIEEL